MIFYLQAGILYCDDWGGRNRIVKVVFQNYVIARSSEGMSVGGDVAIS